MKRSDLNLIRMLLEALIEHEECVIDSNLPYGQKRETTREPNCRDAIRIISKTKRSIAAITKEIGDPEV